MPRSSPSSDPPASPASRGVWFVYLIRNERGALYAGITTEIERRLEQHRSGRGSKFLRGSGTLTLVYRRKLGERSLALRVEHGLKRLRKEDKEALVRSAPSRARLLRRLEIGSGAGKPLRDSRG